MSRPCAQGGNGRVHAMLLSSRCGRVTGGRNSVSGGVGRSCAGSGGGGGGGGGGDDAGR
jgi:hypothetical protein